MSKIAISTLAAALLAGTTPALAKMGSDAGFKNVLRKTTILRLAAPGLSSSRPNILASVPIAA